MQQSGYIEVAGIIATIDDDAIRKLIAQVFAREFGRRRSQFKRHLFVKACGVEDT